MGNIKIVTDTMSEYNLKTSDLYYTISFNRRGNSTMAKLTLPEFDSKTGLWFGYSHSKDIYYNIYTDMISFRDIIQEYLRVSLINHRVASLLWGAFKKNFVRDVGV
jgi:hypothetical protein